MASSSSSRRLFPRFVTFKGDNGQLLTINTIDGIPYLTFTALEPSRLATHEIICSSKDSPDLVMIRSSNGRFWSRNEDNWIVASREDRPASSDTGSNFRVVSVSDNTTIALQSLADGSFLRCYSQCHVQHGCNAVGCGAADCLTHLEVCKAADTALVLPRFLMFKADNDLFLSASQMESKLHINWLSFTNAAADVASVHEVTVLPNGNVMIQNVKTGRYWRCSSVNWVWADVEQANAMSNVACHFEPVKVSSSEVGFRSVFANRFLKRYTEYWTDSLCAIGPGLNDPTTHFVVNDAIASQSLTNISYSLKLAEVVEVKSLVVGRGSATNRGDKAADLQVQVGFSSSVARTQNWADCFTFIKGRPVATFTIGVPEVLSAQGSITVGVVQCFKKYVMGSTLKETVQFQSTYTVKNVAPGEEVTVSVKCTRGKCRVPFSYSVKKTRVDGLVLPVIDSVDGIFEGVSIFNTQAVVTSPLRSTTYLPVCSTLGATASMIQRQITAAL